MILLTTQDPEACAVARDAAEEVGEPVWVRLGWQAAHGDTSGRGDGSGYTGDMANAISIGLNLQGGYGSGMAPGRGDGNGTGSGHGWAPLTDEDAFSFRRGGGQADGRGGGREPNWGEAW